MDARMGYKVCVYAICKNEAKFAARWMESMREADWVVALDTGSQDGTMELLRDEGAIVERKIVSPWRFDAARNLSLELIPDEADICVCTDLDEVFVPGWREALERCWTDDATQARYRYTWNFQADGSEGVVFWPEKIHKNKLFRWVGPVHEVLSYLGEGPQKMVTCRDVQLNHHADPAKPRSQYLPLLELAVSEDPENDRNMHYLGREYMYYGQWAKCIETLRRHLRLKSATWADERCASMRYIARAYQALGDAAEAQRWLYRAIGEAPHLREPYVEMAKTMYEAADWAGAAFMMQRALNIEKRPDSYICEAEAWGPLPLDLSAVALYRLGLYAQSTEMARRALALAPQDERLRENLRLCEEALASRAGAQNLP